MGTFCQGLVASMEKQASQHKDYDVSSISAVKASLMGPMSGIGDTLFWGILRVIAAGVAMTFGMQGNILAPFVFLLIYNIPAQWCRWEMTKLGFSVGSEYITEMYSSGLLTIFTKAARTLGLIMLGRDDKQSRPIQDKISISCWWRSSDQRPKYFGFSS